MRKILGLFLCINATAQTGVIEGRVASESTSDLLPVVLVYLPDTRHGTVTDEKGIFRLTDISEGTYQIEFRVMGYQPHVDTIRVYGGQTTHMETVRLKERVTELDELVFSATRTQRKVDDVPVQVSLIQKEQIRNMGSMRLGDLLSEQTGMTVVSDHGNGVQVQGFSSEYTMIMINGQPILGRTAGTLDLDRISVNNVKQIEITKGPSSSLYGSEALAGVINIITEEPPETFGGSVQIKHRTYNTNDVAVSLNNRINKFTSAINLNSYSSDGYDLDDSTVSRTAPPFFSYTLDGNFSLGTSSNSLFKLYTRYYNEDQDNQSAITDEDDDEQVLDVTGNRNDFIISPSFVYDFTEYSRLTVLNYTSTYRTSTDYSYQPDGSTYDHSYFHQFFNKTEVQADVRLNRKNTLTSGAGYIRESLQSSRYTGADGFATIYGFVQDEWRANAKLTVLAGGRFDSHSEYASQFSPKLAAQYRFSRWLKVKGSFGTGFKAPDFRQLFLDYTNPAVGYSVFGSSVVRQGMEELEAQGQIARMLIDYHTVEEIRAETSRSYNLGVDLQPTDRSLVKVNFFRNDITDLIDSQPIAGKTNGSQVYTYFNIHKVFTQGAEVNLNARIGKVFNISAGYQYLDAKDKDVVDRIADGKVFKRNEEGNVVRVAKSEYGGLFNRSRHTANAKVFYTSDQYHFNVNLRAVYRGKFGFGDVNSNTILDDEKEYASGYLTWHLAATKYFLEEKLSCQAGVDNLFGATNSYVPTMPGRLIYAAVAYRFSKNEE